MLEAGITSKREVDTYQSTVSFLAGLDKPRKYVIVNMTYPAKKTISCPFCNGNHGPNECTKISTVEQRLSIVKNQRLCYNCQVSQCRSRARCMCHRKHHASIYSQPSSSPTPEERPEVMTLHSTTTRSQTNVLLKTAISSVGTGNTKFSAGILFDKGSQRSYITQELAESLQFPVDGTEMLSISSFDGNTTQVQVNKGTIFVWTDDNEKIPLHVVIVPTIAQPIDISMTSFAVTLPYLRRLKFTNNNSEQRI